MADDPHPNSLAAAFGPEGTKAFEDLNVALLAGGTGPEVPEGRHVDAVEVHGGYGRTDDGGGR